MSLCHSFAPLLGTQPRLLIVGSMPGRQSLQQQRYYAHPQNSFWPIMASFYGFSAELPYAERIALLQQQALVLWDVLQQCERQGSLDSQIQKQQLKCHDFQSLLSQHSGIQTVLCNGGTAYQLWQKHVTPTLSTSINVIKMPSTSPAYATLKRAEKCAIWHQQLQRAFAESHS